MAKKIAAKADQRVGFGHIPKFTAYMKQGTVVPTVIERYTGDPWIYFGKRNLWPEEMRELAFNCGPLERSMHTLAMMIAGNGVKFYDREGNELEDAKGVFINELLKDTTEEDFLFACAYDIAFLNSCSIVVRRELGGEIARLDHLDVSRLRSGQLQDDGRPSEYYWSTDWKRYRTGARYEPKAIPRYMGERERSDRSVIYSKGYTQGSTGDAYAVPWWTGCINAAQTWAKVDRFNSGQIDTGFMAGMHLHTFTNKPDNELEAYDERVMNAYTGATSRGLWHTYGLPGEGAPVLTPIPFTSYAGQLDEIRNGSASVIYSTYGIPGALVNELTKTGMDGAATALIQARALVDSMLVRPKRQLLTKAITRVMNDKGLVNVWETRVDPIDFIDQGEDDVLARQAYLRSVKVNEYREDVLDKEPLPGEEGEKLLIESGSKAPTDTTNADI